MSAKFTQNAILFRTIHSSCLVCETYLPSEKAASKHILLQEHKINLEASYFVEEFNGDYIRKVKKGFYCELCNKHLTTLIKVRFHVSDKEHIRNKGTKMFERMGDGVIVFKDVAIKNEAWHGIIDDKCIICDVYIYDMKAHTSGSEHAFNLVLMDVEFGIQNGLYRMVGDSFQCLTCNELFKCPTRACISYHFVHPNHQEIYEKLQKIAADIKNSKNCEGTSEIASGLPSPKKDDESPIIKKEPMEKYVNEFYSIDDPIMGSLDIVINSNILVNISSFYFISNSEVLKCEACEVTLTDDEVEAHKLTKDHEMAMRNTPVIELKSSENEFIREIRSDIYHCGVCNCIENGLKKLMKHLNTCCHKEKRIAATWRLHTYRLSLI